MRPRLIILGAGHSRDAGQPMGLQRVTLDGRVLDWQLDAFSTLAPEVEFVGGYDIDQVMRHFPALTYHFNREWRETGAVASLAQAFERTEDREESCDLYIVYSDILLRPALVRAVAEAPDDRYAIALDMACPESGSRRHQTERLRLGGVEGEFVGLVRVPATLSTRFRRAVLDHATELRTSHLSALLSRLIEQESETVGSVVRADGLWGHAEHGHSVARFILGTKAATLHRLQERLTRSRILPLVFFERARWDAQPSAVVDEVVARFGTEKPLIVRSSATDEDGFARANAGRYHSELHVAPTREALSSAVAKVFASYSSVDPSDQVLVQPQLQEVRASGVVFTRVLATGAPYRILNYSETGDTTAITSGADTEGMKLVIARSAPPQVLDRLPPIARTVLTAVEEIERCVCYDALDIEFAITTQGEVLTLQVRPLMIGDAQQDRTLDADVDDALSGIHATIQSLDCRPRGQLGTRAVWSVMADWNPAEIIGLTPGPLALDLYRYIITDHTWATQRREAGYRHVAGHPLVRSFGGQAFVDVRASVNSFIPASLPDSIAARMVEYGLAKLRSEPALHDKIEFEVIPTCLDFNFADWRRRYRQDDSLSDDEIDRLEIALAEVTNTIIGRTEADIAAATALESCCPALELPTAPVSDWLSRTLDSCRDGALTFAHLARAGFVSAALLRSAVNRGILAAERRDALMASITTVGGMIAGAAWDVRNGSMSRDAFIARFGHLRPGTYDISAPAYRHRPVEYIDPIIASAKPPEKQGFMWTPVERENLDVALADSPLDLDSDALLAFVRAAVAGREYSKFVFTRLLSAVLDGMADEARRHGIAPGQLEALPLHALTGGAVEVWGASEFGRGLKSMVQQRSRVHRLAGLISLPPVLAEPSDVYAFCIPESQPTFITSRRVRVPLKVVRPGVIARREDVEGRIVAITNADPGFDYVFGLGIKGLITAYGGPNSHMAIRASEFAIPAIIGIGARSFERLMDGVVTEIDSHKRRWSQQGYP